MRTMDREIDRGPERKEQQSTERVQPRIGVSFRRASRSRSDGQAGGMRSDTSAHPVRATGLIAACGLALAACGHAPERASHATSGASAISERHDPRTARALLRIARAFNNDYQQNKDAPVYARWDATSQAIISQTTYLRRHRDCPNDPNVKVNTWGVTHGPEGAWLVHYSIDGQQFTDWWYYVHGRFVFDLPKSNPSAVALYKASPAQYVKEMGCGH